MSRFHTRDEDHANYQSISETNNDPLATVAGSELHNDNAYDYKEETPPPPPDTDTDTTSIARNYRGFSTSIQDLFAFEAHDRVDCCAVTCCGILQHDRDRYLLTGVAPPSPLKRILMHLLLPCSIFFAAGLGAMRISDRVANQIYSTGLVLLLFFYFLVQCAKGRAKRVAVRRDLLFAKYQIQQHADEDVMEVLDHDRHSHTSDGHHGNFDYLGQRRHDMLCAHPCCLIGMYADDRPVGHERHNPHMLSSLFDTLCPGMCGMHWQLCGLCAIAQEAREVEACILPAPYRRIDYITMEPWHNYYPAIYKFRHNAASSVAHQGSEQSHTTEGPSATAPPTMANTKQFSLFGHALSRLSTRLLRAVLLVWAVALVWSILAGPLFWDKIMGNRRAGNRNGFELPDSIILICGFLQSFAILWVWAYFTNRSKHSGLSLDAIVKYYASGFFLSASLALFWEMCAALALKTFVSLLLAIAGVDVMSDPESDGDGYQMTRYMPGSVFLTTITTPLFQYMGFDNAPMITAGPDYSTAFGYDHPVVYTIYIFVATFVVTAFIEEICKYFGYRMVEHPDFASRAELVESALIVHQHNPRPNPEDEEEVESLDRVEHVSIDFSKQLQSVQAQGAAITLAMVAVAVGFSCCENLLYIFFYAGDSVALEVGVLVERAFFPVHPILAAIQSVGVCQRDLEASRATKLGRILFPAVMFHGSYDFFIAFISFIGKLVGERVEDGDLRITNTCELLSVISCVLIMLMALAYYYVEGTKQRERLIAIDREATVDRSSLV